MKLRWQIIIFGLVHALIFTAFFQASINNNLAWSNADRLYLSYASRLFSGELFYRDFFIEYPPLAMLFFSLPRLVTGDLDGYIIAFTIETFIADLVALVLLALLSRRLGVRPRYTMLAMTVALIALGPIMISRYDIFPAVMVLAGFFLFFRGRDTMPWIWLALGTVTKLYPVLLTPLLAAYYWRTSQYRQLVKGSSAFVLLIAAVILPFLIIAPDGFTAFLKYQLVRGLQLESVYSSFLLIGHIIHNGAITVTYNFGSWNLVTQAADFIAEISFYLSLYVLIVVFALMVKYIYQCDPAVPREQLISPWAAYGLTIILGFLITTKVLSPEYLIWLLPFIPLTVKWFSAKLVILYASIGLLTFYVFPWNYRGLLDLETSVIVVLFLRNLLLIALFALLILKFLKVLAKKSGKTRNELDGCGSA